MTIDEYEAQRFIEDREAAEKWLLEKGLHMAADHLQSQAYQLAHMLIDRPLPNTYSVQLFLNKLALEIRNLE